ncbi:IclR family transcriptional regulator [Georgenia sp. AZ-5]|uniref:IclR family transcriptional regulator n=1 Tax=Georgenia sp. AZ-5 TaxID=3367526 RepID=UPI0037544760
MTGTLKSVDQALAVLEQLAAAPEPQTLTSLSRQFGVSKATMHRLLTTLRARGYVVQDPITARYGFGPAPSRLAQQAGAAACLTEACWPAMRWLWRKTEETVLLAVREGDKAVVVEKLDSPHPVLATYSLGRLMPMHAVSTGMVLLAHLPDAEIREIITAGLARYTSHTPTSPEAVWEAIRSVRRKGYAINRERLREGVCGVAAPVRGNDPRRPVSAAIAVCVPSSRFEPQADALCEAVVVAAARASEAVATAATRASEEPVPGITGTSITKTA